MNEQASKKAEKNAFRHREVLKRPQHTQWIRGIVCKYQKLRDDAIGVGRGIVCKYQKLKLISQQPRRNGGQRTGHFFYVVILENLFLSTLYRMDMRLADSLCQGQGFGIVRKYQRKILERIHRYETRRDETKHTYTHFSMSPKIKEKLVC